MGPPEDCTREAGHADVQTYIQSGNVVFSSKRALGASFTKAIEEAIRKKSGLRVDVLIRTARKDNEALAQRWRDEQTKRSDMERQASFIGARLQECR